LFEQVAIMLVRDMPVLAAARIIGITDQRLWRIVEHYVTQAVERIDLTRLKAIGLDETAVKRGQSYVTVFLDLDRKDKPVIFVTPGRVALRWAILKRADGRLTNAQADALAELQASALLTAIAWRIKEMLCWIRKAESVQAARWRITHFLRHASQLLADDPNPRPGPQGADLLRQPPRAHPPALDVGP
jgi:Helix-turn-helix domain of transposase family ISL3